MKRIALIFAALFVLVIGISCVSAASLDVEGDAVASEAPALLGNGLGGGLGGGLGSGFIDCEDFGPYIPSIPSIMGNDDPFPYIPNVPLQ